MTLPKYNNQSIWGSWEKFLGASDEQVEAWCITAKEIDESNKQVYRERAVAYQAIVRQTEELFGTDSLQHKYIKKNPIKPFFNNNTHGWEQYSRQRKEQLQKKADEAKRLEKEKQRLETQRKANFLSWEIAKRHNMPVEADIDPYEVMEFLTDSNRYLDLAAAMEATRNDWSDGFDRVQYALSRFQSHSDGSIGDKAIIDDISDCLDGDHEDGRVFRDTEWSYDKLYALAPKELVEDYIKLQELRDWF